MRNGCYEIKKQRKRKEDNQPSTTTNHHIISIMARLNAANQHRPSYDVLRFELMCGIHIAIQPPHSSPLITA